MAHRSPRPPLVLLAGGVVASIGVLVPVVYIGVRATDRGWGAITDTLWRRRTADLLWRSVELGIVVTVVSAVLGIGCAWLVSSTDLPGRRFLQVTLALPLALPSYIVGGLVGRDQPRRFSSGVTTVAYAGHSLPGIVVALSLVTRRRLSLAGRQLLYQRSVPSSE